MAKRVTVIDIGSNSVGMVVYEKTSRFSFKILHQAKSKVRISQDAYKNAGELQAIPMQRTYDTLDDFISISQSFKARKILCVATSALRDAPNKQDFIHRVRDNLKLNIKVIDGVKEAYLGGIACANLLPPLENSLSIDIGGGSTEFSIINSNNVSHSFSVDLGTIRIKELFYDSDEIEEAKKYIDEKLDILHKFDPTTLVGIGGTLRAISTSVMQANNYPFEKLHAYEYSLANLETILDKIFNATPDELKILGIKENRLDVIKPGALILQRVVNKLSLKNIITSNVGVKEGVYLSDLLRNSKHKFPSNYNVSVKQLIDTYSSEQHFSSQYTKLVKKLFLLTKKYFEIDTQYKTSLSIASKLYTLGTSINFASKYENNYYLVLKNLEYGFKHTDIILIATLVSNENKLISKYGSLLPNKELIQHLRFILNLSKALLTHRPRNIDFSYSFKDGVLNIESKKKLYLSREAVNKLDFPQGFKINF